MLNKCSHFTFELAHKRVHRTVFSTWQTVANNIMIFLLLLLVLVPLLLVAFYVKFMKYKLCLITLLSRERREEKLPNDGITLAFSIFTMINRNTHTHTQHTQTVFVLSKSALAS